MSIAQSQFYDLSDSLALLEIDAACDKYNVLNWNTESNPGSWNKITWNDENPRKVIQLDFNELPLEGNMDVSGLVKLESLQCETNRLTTLNASGLMELKFLDCSNNWITSINLSGTTNLLVLICGQNQLTNLNLTGLVNLEYLDCWSNHLNKLDISAQSQLTTLICDSNPDLNMLDLSSNTYLSKLICTRNRIEELDLSSNKNISYLDCCDNKLTSLNVTDLRDLDSLNCSNNYLPFTSLASGLHATDFSYSPQHIIFGSQVSYTDITIDYSAEALIEGIPTQFIFYRDSIKVEENTTGIFTTLGNGTYYCEMTNANFPGLRLTTKAIIINFNLADYSEIDCQALLAIDAANDHNGSQLNWTEEPANPERWIGVTWSTEIPKRVVELDLNKKGLYYHLDVSHLTSLVRLNCSDNNLYALLLPRPTSIANLIYLDCHNNDINWIDELYQKNLSYLNCQNNRMTFINLENLTSLTFLDCRNNYFSLSQIVKGHHIPDYYYSPQGKPESYLVGRTFDYSSDAMIEDSITHFYFYKDSILQEVNTTGIFTTIGTGDYYCSMTNSKYPEITLTMANVSIYKYDESDCKTLFAIDSACDSHNTLNWNTEPNPNNWYGIYWTDGSVRRVKELWIDGHSLTGTLNVSSLGELSFLLCEDNQLTSLVVSDLTKLSYLNCNINQLSSLDISGLTNLKELACGVNKLTNLDISGLDNLTVLFCNHNPLITLDLISSNSLTEVYCYLDSLTSLNVTGLKNLETLYCGDNQLTTLDVSNLSNLRLLVCSNNQLSNINVSGCADLTHFCCFTNQLTHLDVSDLVNLVEFQCWENQLIELDVSRCTNLIGLHCLLNHLTSLDVSMLINLLYLQCGYNNIPFSALILGQIEQNLLVFDYLPQDTIYQPMSFTGNTTIDYSSEALIENTPTNFIFYKNGTMTEINNTGLYTTTGNGEYHCIMTNSIFSDLSLITAPVTITGVTGLEDNGNLITSIYPNPTKDHIFFSRSDGIGQVSINSLTGTELIKTSNISTGIDLSGLSKGTYLIRITGNRQQEVQKIVIE